MKIVYVSDLIEKGRWRLNHYFYLRAANLSETRSIDEYFVVHARRVDLDNGGIKRTKTIRAAFCLQKFLQLQTPGVQNIVLTEDNEVFYKSIGNHPEAGDVEVGCVQDWDDYIELRPEIIEFAINDKTSLICYEEY